MIFECFCAFSRIVFECFCAFFKDFLQFLWFFQDFIWFLWTLFDFCDFFKILFDFYDFLTTLFDFYDFFSYAPSYANLLWYDDQHDAHGDNELLDAKAKWNAISYLNKGNSVCLSHCNTSIELRVQNIWEIRVNSISNNPWTTQMSILSN